MVNDFNISTINDLQAAHLAGAYRLTHLRTNAIASAGLLRRATLMHAIRRPRPIKRIGLTHSASPFGSSVGWFGSVSALRPHHLSKKCFSLCNKSETIRGRRQRLGDFEFMAKLGLLPFAFSVIGGLDARPGAQQHVFGCAIPKSPKGLWVEPVLHRGAMNSGINGISGASMVRGNELVGPAPRLLDANVCGCVSHGFCRPATMILPHASIRSR